jgi:hypothetical protein
MSFSQTRTISGLITDQVIGEPQIGVNIVYGPGMGTVTDIDGKYILDLEPGEYDLTISYVGFITQKKHIVVKDKNLFINFVLKTVTLEEAVIVADLAMTRETPVAFSNITAVKIEEQLASQDIPLILNATPGVYATQSGGGDGDARINIRGFNQRNVAVMLDGIPVNDMENGWVYWSNWFGLDAVMRGTQVQRGLGMSKLAIPSVGGTINITTKGIDAKKGISLKQEVGTAGYLRTTLGLTTGRLNNGWGVTFAGSYKKGDGWVDQTWTEGWFYFLRVDKELGKHLLSATAMGAPQEHGQRKYKKYIATFDRSYAEKSGMRSSYIDTLESSGLPIDQGLRYNPNWGYLERTYITDTDTIYPGNKETSTANNYYNKPMFTLKDFWSVNDKLYISNVAYLSIGSGGGRTFSPTPSLDKTTKQQDLQSVYNNNMNIPNGFNPEKRSYGIMRNGVNNHFWLGLLSTFDYTINDAFSLSGGVDLRTYKGEHYREVQDLMGGNFYIDESDTTKKYVGDKIGYNNDALVRWGGLFSMLKYQTGSLTAFINISGSMSGYKRIDYFLPKFEDGSNNQTDWKYLGGITTKGGVNYNLNETMNIFLNIGYMSKAQRFSNVFSNYNTEYLQIENEKIKAIELGYSYVLPRLVFNVNTYYTVWKNKPADRTIMIDNPDNEEIPLFVKINKMNARHMGLELEFAYKITKNLHFESLLSLGDWIWTSKDTAMINDENGNLLKKMPFDARGLHVGDAAQFQNRESLRWEIYRGLYISGSFTWFGKHYSEFNPLDYRTDDESYEYAFDENGDPRQSWEIPDYYMVDLHAGYSWYVDDVKFQIRGSILNLLDDTYITDAQNNDPYLVQSSSFDANSAGVFMGMGRRFNISLKVSL